MRGLAVLVVLVMVGCAVETDRSGVSQLAVREAACGEAFEACRAEGALPLEDCRVAYQECMAVASHDVGTGSEGEASGDGVPAEGSGDGVPDGPAEGSDEASGDGVPAEGSGDGVADGPAEGSGDGVPDGDASGGLCQAQYDGCRAQGDSEVACEALAFDCAYELCAVEYEGCRASGSAAECRGLLAECMAGAME